METDHDLRASDADRQGVVDRLRAALETGRLTVDEFGERMERAYRARTYGELAVLHRDLPATEAGAAAGAAHTRLAACTPAAPASGRLPAGLRGAWTAWLIAVGVNVVVWVLVCATNLRLIYPWPLWVAGPWGAVLAASTLPALRSRRPRAGGYAPLLGEPLR